MTVAAAEDKKQQGNTHFAAKEYDKAIEQYTDAIKLDRNNHVYYSNRSAAYASKKDWEAAVSDAKECIKLNPTFLKGFYRLATAQIELNDLDAALSTIKQGLNVDPENSQLHRQLRTVKAKKKAAAQGAASSSSGAGGSSLSHGLPYAAAADAANNKELVDLQQQWRQSKRDYGVAQAEVNSLQREAKVDAITKSELEQLPENTSSKMYRGVGKMFMLSTRDEIFSDLEKSIKDAESREADVTKKLSYLENRIKSQEQNIRELIAGAN